MLDARIMLREHSFMRQTDAADEMESIINPVSVTVDVKTAKPQPN